MNGPDAAFLARSRDAAALLMIDVCEIRGPSTLGPMDPVTGRRPTVPGTLRVAGQPCKIQTYQAQATPTEVGAHLYAVDRYMIHCRDVVKVFTEDVVTITASEKSWNVGRVFKVAGSLDKTYQTANRIQVTEISA